MLPKTQRILIAGAVTYSYWHFGYESAFAGMLEDLRREFPGYQIGVLSANPAGFLDKYSVYEIPISDIQQLIEFGQEADLFLLGGGDVSDYLGIDIESLLTSSQFGVGVYIGFAFLSALLKKPLMIYAVGVGPLCTEIGKHFISLAFQQASLITVRNLSSQNELCRLGIPKDKIFVTADTVWTLPKISKQSGLLFLSKQEASSFADTIGVVFESSEVCYVLEEWERELAQALDKFVEKHGNTIVFLPIERKDGRMEVHLPRKIIGHMKHADKCFDVENIGIEITLEEALSILSCCQLVVGIGFYANILAISHGIPTIGVSCKPEVFELLDQVGLGMNYIDVRMLTSRRLSSILEKAWKEKDESLPILEKFVTRAESQARQNSHLASTLVSPKLKQEETPFSPDILLWIEKLFSQSTLGRQEAERLLSEIRKRIVILHKDVD